jgi:hypothetical protein
MLYKTSFICIKLFLVVLIQLFVFFDSFGLRPALAVQFDTNIYVQPHDCFNETCFDDIDDYANSPLVECSYL